ASLRQALAQGGSAEAATTFAKVTPWLDRWAAEWSAARVRVCRETELEGARSPALGGLAEACLDERRDELRGLLDALSDGDAASLRRAVPAVAGLSPIDPCGDPVALARRPAPPDDPSARARAQEIRRGLLRAGGLASAGRYAEALAVAEAARAEAEALGYPPLTADARMNVGYLTARTGAIDAAIDALTRAYVDAGVVGEDEVALRAAIHLVGTVGYLAARPAEGLTWWQSVQMLLRRLRLDDQLLGAHARVNVAAVYHLREEPDVAIHLLEEALALRERLLGEAHPQVADLLVNLAEARRARGEFDAAGALQRRALGIYDEALGPDHPSVALVLGNLALTERTLGHRDEARALNRRALAIREAALGPDHPEVAISLSYLAEDAADRGELEASMALSARALAIREAALGPDHPDVGQSLATMAGYHLLRGELDEAERLLDRAVAVIEAALGPDHVELSGALVGVARLALARERPRDAIAPLERAAILRATYRPDARAEVDALLARALWDAPEGEGRDRSRARALAEGALEVLRSTSAPAAEIEPVEAWLVEHPG
ncbi:MAG: tetratricopeptide repeat protein, partial [Nannocystaceae bacterium]